MLLHRALVVLGLLALSFTSRADIAIQATRLVHQGSDRMVVQRVWNQGDKPSMIQSWTDGGDINRSLEARGRLPFFVTPPLFQLEPGRNHDISVRLVDATALPADRESLYWLNILDLPASERAHDTMNIAYAVRWRVKLFHRPAGLQGTPDAAPAQLAWSMHDGGSGMTQLRARNDSPYHVSLRELSVADASIDLLPDSAVILPFSEWSIDMPESLAPKEGMSVSVVWLDDKAESHTLAATASCRLARCGPP
ncbi:fimbrial biogenesis chaperone [Stenotrophomonas maltophilia]|uniref:fimbrial biogenesis chaperone n=1 Tax=Stenotrophomonas maltophilia TaxID=40324 RepID=UPI0009B29470|nr:fimbria/pilus periplasmic chaperone [Stenotrophomonas maltophilia]